MPVQSSFNGSRNRAISKDSNPSYEISVKQVILPDTGNLTDVVGNFVIIGINPINDSE